MMMQIRNAPTLKSQHMEWHGDLNASTPLALSSSQNLNHQNAFMLQDWTWFYMFFKTVGFGPTSEDAFVTIHSSMVL